MKREDERRGGRGRMREGGGGKRGGRGRMREGGGGKRGDERRGEEGRGGARGRRGGGGLGNLCVQTCCLHEVGELTTPFGALPPSSCVGVDGSTS